MTNNMNSNGQSSNLEKKNRQGRNIAYWFPVGVGTGVALGVLLENLALGIAIGAAFGVALGMAADRNCAGAADPDAGTPGKLWIYAIAAAGGLLLLAGMIFLIGLLTR